MSKDKFKIYCKSSPASSHYDCAVNFETLEEAQKFQANRDDFITDNRIYCLFKTGDGLMEASLIDYGNGLSIDFCDGGDGGSCKLDNLIDFLALAFPDKLKAALENNNDDS